MKKFQFHQKFVGNNHTRKNGIKRDWNRNTVKRILQNVTYLGSVSNGNVKKINYKSKKVMIMPMEERIIVEDMHEPLVDKETFNIVQEIKNIIKKLKYFVKKCLHLSKICIEY